MLKKTMILLGVAASLCCQTTLMAHCQMPCGIYHDDMIFDRIDQYIETMYKAISVMNDSKFSTVRERNEFCRWVLEKERESDETAQLITKYFLQQKIKPGEKDTAKRIESAHLLLFALVQIKQNADLKILDSFSHEWDKFKLMFHVEGYECEMEKMKTDERAQKEAAAKAATK